MKGPIDVASVRKAHAKFVRSVFEEAEEALHQAGEYAESHVKNRSKFKRQSRFRSVKDSTSHKVVRTSAGHVVRITNSKKTSNGYDVAVGLERGTKKHPIEARFSSVLAFRGRGGRMVFRRRVEHKGTRAFWFLRSAAKAAYERMGPKLQRRLEIVGRRF